ncbi:MAG: LutC/YkgG family protein, partial [Bryobacteraceae bacterium]
MIRDHVLHKVRTALLRSAGQAPEPAPPPMLKVPSVTVADRVDMFCAALGKLAGKTYVAGSPAEARSYAEALATGRKGVASDSAVLRECGITDLAGVASGFGDAVAWRAACASADVGITGADYALADTGTLVFFSSAEEPRLVSLLPPVHLAVVARERLLTGLDELFTLIPDPAEVSSSLVFVTGPSRTADIEQILVRGVHGPGEIHV